MPQSTISKESAIEANQQFDRTVKNFLRGWLLLGSPDDPSSPDDLTSINAFVDGGALREFFKRQEEPLQQLLANPGIATHLCRTHRDVYFDPATNEPLVSPMEARVYNLAAHRQHLQVPYRFLPTARQGAHGDRAEDHELPEERRGKPTDIGDYFATRRADATVIDTMHRELQHAIRRPTRHVHLTTDIFMPDALHSAHQRVETLRQEGMTTPQFFVLQHRYSTEGVDRHFGAALLIFDPQMPDRPKRIVLCDTVNLPGWLPRFRQLVEHEFGPDAAGRIEVASHPLQGLNREPQACRHDLNCSFYTRSMARALLRLAQDKPHLLLSGETGQIHEAMKPLMKDYYANGLAKPPEEIRETNLYKRWNIGRSMLLGHSKLATRLEASEEQSWVSHVEQRMQDRELGIGLDAPLIAKR